MKKSLLIIFIAMVVTLQAQTDRNYILRASIGYSYSHKDKIDLMDTYSSNGVYGEKDQAFYFTFRAGRKLKSNFNYGLGFSLNSSREELNPEEDFPEMDTSSGYVSFISSRFTQLTKSKTYSPSVYFEYYYDISKTFTLCVDAWSRFDISSSKSEANLDTHYLPQDTSYIVINNTFKVSKRRYLAFGLSPSLRININKNLGLEFIFGSLEYRMKLKDSRAPKDARLGREFNFGFEPGKWRFGVYLRI